MNKIENLYDIVICEEEITTKLLNWSYITSKDIKKYMEEGILTRVKRGYYIFNDVDGLYYYGKQFIKSDQKKATRCFEKCYEINPKHSSACFQLFLRSIIKKDYKKAFTYFEGLNFDNENYIKDYNIFLYLLNLLTDIPTQYKEKVKKINFEDVKVTNSLMSQEQLYEYNYIRKVILDNNIVEAIKLLNIYSSKEHIYVQDILIRNLLFQVKFQETKTKSHIIALIAEKQYLKVKEILDEKTKKQQLSKNDKYVLELINVILNIQNEIPKPQTFNTTNIFEAIDGHNYELALQLCNKHIEENNFNKEKNILYLLLKDINEIIFSYNVESKITPSVKKVTVNFSDILNCLMKKEIDKAYESLGIYLKNFNKIDYEFLIKDFIQLSLLEGDLAFTKPMVTLTYIIKDDYKFEISEYIQEFYIALSQNKLKEARILLDIIYNGNKLSGENVITEALFNVLEQAEIMLYNSKQPQIIQEDKKVSLKVVDTKEEKKDVPVPKVQNTPTVNITNSKRLSDDEEFIKTKYELLKKDLGCIILKPMNIERRKNIHEIVKTYSDLDSFSISYKNERQVVLRYRPYIEEKLDTKEMLSQANAAYLKKEYDTTISIYLKLLSYFKTPAPHIYAKLGLCYLKLKNIDKAITYLTIATKLEVANNTFDFIELIEKLKGNFHEEDKKAYFKMSLEDFKETESKDYNISNFNEIVDLITETGLDVESACLSMGMTEEQINIVLLLFAKNYYTQKNYEKGSEFLKIVEKNPNKTKIVSQLFNEVTKNRKFYSNQSNNEMPVLSLTIQAKKSNSNKE